jgi:protoporphyrinogen oxidase
VHFGCEVRGIDAARRTLVLASGERVRYGAIVSGLPLDVLLARLEGRADLVERARALRHTSVHATGLGFDAPLSDELEGKCWLYFADPAMPFYRATVMSTYSPDNVPEPGRQCSFLLEVATTEESPLDPGALVPQCESALRAAGIVPRDARTLARWHRLLPRGYPVPTLGRDAILHPIDAELRAARIWSRGRFGGWKYEVSNQDHAFHQGVEAVDAALLDAAETTWPDPDTANAGRAPVPAGARPVRA